jgi:hypothetical protein
MNFPGVIDTVEILNLLYEPISSVDTEFVDFRGKYLSEYEAICEAALTRYSPSPKKNKGQKSLTSDPSEFQFRGKTVKTVKKAKHVKDLE